MKKENFKHLFYPEIAPTKSNLKSSLNINLNQNKRTKTCQSTPRLTHDQINTAKLRSTQFDGYQTAQGGQKRHIGRNLFLHSGLQKSDINKTQQSQTTKTTLSDVKEFIIDFELMKQVQDKCQAEERSQIVNPCYMHPQRPIKFICRDDVVGLCSECMLDHFQQNHKLIQIEHQAKEVQTVLLNLEHNLQEILKSKNNILKKHEAQIGQLNDSKKLFLAQQKQKIEMLKKYLDERYLHIVCQYNIAYEKDVILNKNKIDKISSKLKSNLTDIKKIQNLREQFIQLTCSQDSKEVVCIESKIIKKFVQTGSYLDYYKLQKEKLLIQNEQDIKKVFATHSQDSVKYLSIDVEKEIQLLTKKFKELNFKQEEAQQLVQRYTRQEKFKEPEVPKRNSKISIPRWFSKKMAEFDFDKRVWQSSTIKNLDLPLFPFSSMCYSPEMNEFFVLGGFNNKVESKSSFSAKVFKISEKSVNPFESVYTAQLLTPMRKQRGYFPSCVAITNQFKVRTNDATLKPVTQEDLDAFGEQEGLDEPGALKDIFQGFIYAIGGKNREDKVMRYCEKYDLSTDTWIQISSLNENRMNASVCYFSINEGLFAFGGEDLQGYFLTSIEQYLIRENKWVPVEISLPFPMSGQICQKVNKKKLLIFGGHKIVEGANGFGVKETSNDVYSFNIALGVLRHLKDYSLKDTVVSLYPCFQMQNSQVDLTQRPVTLHSSSTQTQTAKEDKEDCFIYLVGEQGPDINPAIVSYPIKSFQPGGENY